MLEQIEQMAAAVCRGRPNANLANHERFRSSSREKTTPVTQRGRLVRDYLHLSNSRFRFRQGVLIRSRDARTFLAQGEYEHICISFSNLELFSCSFESKLCTLRSRFCSVA